MKIKVLVLGKTDAKALKELIQKHESRLRHYIPFSMEIIPDLKHTQLINLFDRSIDPESLLDHSVRTLLFGATSGEI